MFFLGKRVEGNGGASQLLSSNQPSLFVPPLSHPASKKARSALGQFQLGMSRRPSLTGWLVQPPLSHPQPGGSFRSLPGSCPQVTQKHIVVRNPWYRGGVLPGFVVWRRKEPPSHHCLVVPSFPAAVLVVVSPVMFSISRPGATAACLPSEACKTLGCAGSPPGACLLGE